MYQLGGTALYLSAGDLQLAGVERRSRTRRSSALLALIVR
jgi:hypothetical protein